MKSLRRYPLFFNKFTSFDDDNCFVVPSNRLQGRLWSLDEFMLLSMGMYENPDLERGQQRNECFSV